MTQSKQSTQTNKDFIKSLSNAKSMSRGTSLITYYLPSESSIWLAVNKLNQELSTASNIKSKTVRKDVITALKSSLHILKTYKGSNAPSNGLVLCSGIIEKNGQWV